MLNELYRAAQAVPSSSLHRWVKPLPKTKTLVALLNRQGVPDSFEPMSEGSREKLRKIQRDKFAQFPALSIAAPLLELEHGIAEELCTMGTNRRADRARLLVSIARTHGPHRRALDAVRRAFALARELAPAFNDAGAYSAITQLICLLPEPQQCEEWLKELAVSLAHFGEEDSEVLAIAELLLAGVQTGRGGKRFLKGGNVTLFLDIADSPARGLRRVASPSMTDFYVQRLPRLQVATSTQLVRCALSGVMDEREAKFPDPTLPVVGPTYLFSMFSEVPCLWRNGKSGSDVFPVGKKTADRLYETISWLTARERQGKTWAQVPDNARSTSNLLIAYLRSAVNDETDVELGNFFSGVSKDIKGDYAHVCRNVTGALRGRVSPGNTDLVDVFVMSRINKGQVQADMSRSYTSPQMIAGATRWEENCGNIPDIAGVSLLIPSPNEVMQLLRRSWVRHGTREVLVPGVPLSVIYDLLIPIGDESRAARAVLAIVVPRHSPLLVRFVDASRRRVSKNRSKIDIDLNVARCCALIGILLASLGRRKETYMTETGFLLGRFHSLCDLLHSEYCQQVRDKKIPLQLLGNAMLPATLANPQRSLANLNHRLRVYQGWARTRGTRLARWSITEMARIAAELHQLGVPERLKDSDRAELLLGYLARSEANYVPNQREEDEHGN